MINNLPMPDDLAIIDLKPGGDKRSQTYSPPVWYHRWRWDGLVSVWVYDESDPEAPRLADFWEHHNQITDVGRNLMADALAEQDNVGASVTSFRIRYVSLGSDAASILPLAASNTTLGAEKFRKAPASTARPSTGQRTTTAYIAPAEACSSGGTGTNFTIQEIGFHAGVSATATTDSGIMVARVLYTRAKSASESLQIVRTDQF